MFKNFKIGFNRARLERKEKELAQKPSEMVQYNINVGPFESFILERNSHRMKDIHASFAIVQVIDNGSDKFATIMTDWAYELLSPISQQCLLLHELGHLYNYEKHFKYASQGSRPDEMETEADMYAVSIMGLERVLKAIDDQITFIAKVRYEPKKDPIIIELESRKAKLIELYK